MLNKYDDKRAWILEENIQSAVKMMSDTSRDLKSRMDNIDSQLEEQWLEKLIPIEEAVKSHTNEIGTINWKIEVAENRMDNIV